jgi:hypothetical protein
MSRVSGDRAGGEQRREVAGSAPPHALLSALAIQAYNEIELKRSPEAEAREDSLRLTKFASGELNRADGVADRGLKSRGRVAIPLDPQAGKISESGNVVRPAQPFRHERTGPSRGQRLRCPLIIYAGGRRDDREDLAVIGRHLHRVDLVLWTAHDIKGNIQVERELFSVITGPFFGHRSLSFAVAAGQLCEPSEHRSVSSA